MTLELRETNPYASCLYRALDTATTATHIQVCLWTHHRITFLINSLTDNMGLPFERSR